MLQGFKDFIIRGNVIDFAVAVVIGGAFGKVVSSLVENLIMPIVGLLSGGFDFSHRFSDLSGQTHATLAAAEAAGAATLNYGNFLNTLINFLIVATAIYFLVVRPMSRLQAPPAETPAPTGPTSEALLAEIRDLLKAR